MTIRSRMCSIMGSIGQQHDLDFVYYLASTDINQSAPNMVKMFVTINSQMSVIMDPIGPELLELSALELEKLQCLTSFTL